METQETPAQHEHKPGHKISAKKLWIHTKHMSKRLHHSLGTGGLVALGLGLLMVFLILSYERRLERLERYRGYSPYTLHTVMPPMFDRGWITEIEDNWSRMNKQFRDMEKRHEKLIQEMQETPKIPHDGQYTGYKMVNGKTFQYTLEVKDHAVNGTLLGTDTDTLTRLRTELENAGVTITNTNGTIQFTAPKEKLEAIVQIVNH